MSQNQDKFYETISSKMRALQQQRQQRQQLLLLLITTK